MLRTRPVIFDGPNIIQKINIINACTIIHNDIDPIIIALYKLLLRRAHIDDMIHGHLITATHNNVHISVNNIQIFEKIMYGSDDKDPSYKSCDALSTAVTHNPECGIKSITFLMRSYNQTIDINIKSCSRCRNGPPNGGMIRFKELSYDVTVDFLRIACEHNATFQV